MDETKTQEIRRGYCTAEYLAKQYNISERQVRRLRADGAFVVEPTENGPRYNILKSFLQYGLYLQKKLDTAGEKQRALTAEANYKERKAELMLLELRKRRGELHEARHIRAIWTHNLIEIRAAFRAIPGRTAQDLSLCAGANEIAATLRQAIDETLHQLANREYDPDEFKKLVEEEGDYVADLDDEDDDEANEQTHSKGAR